MSDIKRYLLWKEVPETWGTAPYVWNDVSIMIHVEDIVHSSGGGGVYFTPSQHIANIEKELSKRDFERFIEMSCRVNEITYAKIKKRKHEKKPILTMSEIQRTIDTVKVSIKVTNISKSDQDI